MIQEVSRSLFLQYHLPIFQVADRLRHREGTRRAQPGSPEDLQGLVACAIAIRPRRPVHQSADQCPVLLVAFFFQLEQYLLSLGPGIHDSQFGCRVDPDHGAELLQGCSEPFPNRRILANCLHDDRSM